MNHMTNVNVEEVSYKKWQKQVLLACQKSLGRRLCGMEVAEINRCGSHGWSITATIDHIIETIDFIKNN